MLIYPHIPKTAGTTMMSILKQNYNSGFYRVMNQGNYRDWLREPRNVREATTCLQGHFTYGVHKHISGPYQYMTFLRDPVERVISFYYYVRDKNSHKLSRIFNETSLATIIKNCWYAATSNDMTRFIVGRNDIGINRPVGEMSPGDLVLAKKHLRGFAAIGFVETFDKDLQTFAMKFGWTNIEYESELVHHTRPHKVDLSPATIALIEKHNKQDLELYAYARKLTEEKILA
jgi:hypothetical protein